MTWQIPAVKDGAPEMSAGATWTPLAAMAAARPKASASSGAGGQSSGATDDDSGGPFVSDKDLREIERSFADGLTAVQVIDLLVSRGVRFSEATFRKYVQMGLLPRSRRVGRKGKHQGSLGLYPATTVRRIDAIKRLQAQHYTIEVIQQQFLRYRDEIESIERSFAVVLDGFEADLGAPHFDAEAKKTLKRDIAEARKAAEELLRRLEGIERRVCEPRNTPTGPTGSGPHGAEDLL